MAFSCQLVAVQPNQSVDVRYVFEDGTRHDANLSQVAGPNVEVPVEVRDATGAVVGTRTEARGSVVTALGTLPPDEIAAHLERYGRAYWAGVLAEREAQVQGPLEPSDRVQAGQQWQFGDGAAPVSVHPTGAPTQDLTGPFLSAKAI